MDESHRISTLALRASLAEPILLLPDGPAHLWTASRYVEPNPIRTGLAEQPVDYEWSSAEVRFSGHDRRRVLYMEFLRRSGGVENWRQLFETPEQQEEYRRLRKSSKQPGVHGASDRTQEEKALDAG